MRIEVTARDIAEAEAWRNERDARITKEGLASRSHLGDGDITRHCPVARAAQRAIPDFDFVGATHVYAKGRVTYGLPRFAMARIEDWDNGRVIEPFSFEVPDAEQ